MLLKGTVHISPLIQGLAACLLLSTPGLSLRLGDICLACAVVVCVTISLGLSFLLC